LARLTQSSTRSCCSRHLTGQKQQQHQQQQQLINVSPRLITRSMSHNKDQTSKQIIMF
jgi:hypothetical protein